MEPTLYSVSETIITLAGNSTDNWQSLSENPSLNFTVVVNPNSGPGSIVPDEHYLRELKTLSTYGNARTVGYVSTDYSKRDINLVKQDILTYKQWDASYAVTGIFFDETPSHFDPAIASYLTTINGTVRNASHGFGPKAMVSQYHIEKEGRG